MAIVAGGASAEAQRLHKRVSAEAQRQKKLVETVDTVAVKDSIWRESYADSLSRARMRIDSMKMDAEDSRFSKLFTPLTFYRSPANHFLRLNPNAGVGDSLDVELDAALLEVKQQIQKALRQYKNPPIPTKQEQIVVPNNSVLVLVKAS